MTNVILIGILILVVVLAIRASGKHFRGEGGCCGGSTYKARRKKLDRVVEKRTFAVAGMHCQHCVNRVTEAVNDLDGAAAAVYLKRGEVVVSLARQIDDEQILASLAKAGYTAKRIR